MSSRPRTSCGIISRGADCKITLVPMKLLQRVSVRPLATGPLLLVFAIVLNSSAVRAQPPADTARAHYTRGLELERQKNLDGAADEYRAALAKAPTLAEA